MIVPVVRSMRSSPWVVVFGTVFFFFAALLSPAWSDLVMEQYEALRPVITDWVVTNELTDGADVSISGTFVKNRDCLLIQPITARDEFAVAHVVESPLWASKDAHPVPQPWGPWKVRDGAGKTLEFSLVYRCSGDRITIVTVGKYKAKR